MILFTTFSDGIKQKFVCQPTVTVSWSYLGWYKKFYSEKIWVNEIDIVLGNWSCQ